MSSGRRAKLGFAVVWGLLGGGALFGQTFRQGVEFQVNHATFNNQYHPPSPSRRTVTSSWSGPTRSWTAAKASGAPLQLRRDHSGQPVPRQHPHPERPAPRGRGVREQRRLRRRMAEQRAGLPQPLHVFGRRFASAARRGGGVPGQHLHSLLAVPKVASDADGDFVVAWQDDAGDPNVAVFARRFDSSGAALARVPGQHLHHRQAGQPDGRLRRGRRLRDRLGERPAGRPRVRNHRQAVQLGGHRAGQRVPVNSYT